MADLLLDTEATPNSPAAGQAALYVNSTTLRISSRDTTGKVLTAPHLTNANTADITANAVDTYLTGSSISIPPQLMQVGAQFIWRFAMSKTAAGTATPIWAVRFGTAGTTSDTARLTFTGVAQTANADAGVAEIWAICRSIGASGVLAGNYQINKNLNSATTGFTNTATPNIIQVTSAGFDMTVASSIIGVSCTPGTSGIWTFQLVSVEALGL